MSKVIFLQKILSFVLYLKELQQKCKTIKGLPKMNISKMNRQKMLSVLIAGKILGSTVLEIECIVGHNLKAFRFECYLFYHL